MAPETIKVFETCKDHLIFQAFQGEEKLLRAKIGEAVAQKRYPDAQTAIHKLESAETTRAELLDAFAKVTEILVNSGLAEIEIPDYEPAVSLPPPAVEEEVEEIPPARARKYRFYRLPGLRKEAYSPFRDQKTFVENSLARAMRATIAKNRKDQFSFETSEEIAKVMLQENLRSNRRAVERATKMFLNGRSDLIRKIKVAGEETHAETVEGLFSVPLQLAKNDEWATFYEEAINDYGNLSLEEFIEKVLKRHSPKDS